MFFCNSIEYCSDKNTVVALGCFDGVHAAHRKIISTATKIAKELSAESLAWTFELPPKNFFSPDSVPIITDINEKRELIEKLSVDKLICVGFDKEIFEMSPVEFFNEILLKRLKVIHIVCGFNYTFGHMGEGDVALLRRLCENAGIGLSVVEQVSINGVPVSSSAIRSALSNGDPESAAALLGHYFSLSAPVFSNQRLAGKLGFPTANQIFGKNKLVPKNGVYVSRILLDGAYFFGITNVGTRPTVSDHTLCAETHIFDFEGDLYGKTITVEFLHFLRDETFFESVGALSAQVHEDILKTKQYIKEVFRDN